MSDKLDVTSQIMSKVGVGFKHLGPKVGKFVARNANGSEILNSGFELVNGIYKNLKKKTPSHTVFLGYIDGQVQLVGEQVKKVKCKLWGKCRAGSVNTANFRIASDANTTTCPIIEVAGEVTEELSQFALEISRKIAKLKNGAKFDLVGTGSYQKPPLPYIAGHHPISKALFTNEPNYDLKEAFSVSNQTLNRISGKPNTHDIITKYQQSEYIRIGKTKKLTLDIVVQIEISAMLQAGIPEDIAKGWIIKSLEQISSKGTTGITWKPRIGLNN